MIYTSYTKTDAYYEFVGSEGKLIMPASDVILVDDESGMLAIKNTASRCTVGLLKIAPPPPTPTFDGKWKATYSDQSAQSADCDASSAITSGEITKTNLVSVEIGDCVTSIGNSAFYGCNSITSCTIGNGVTTIGNYTFEANSLLASINIPNSVTTIGINAFYACVSLKSCTIGSGVTSIGEAAFRDCSSMTSITLKAITPPTLGANAFANTSCPIYVPAASVSAYQTAWNGYASRIQAIQ